MKQWLIVGWCFLFAPLFSSAGGFQINTQSQKAIGIGGSLTALALDASASFYNPAGLSFLEENYINAGFSIIVPKTAYLGSYTSTENMSSHIFTPFYVYGSYKLKGKWTAGLSINTPFGLGTQWEDNWSGRYLTQKARLNSIYIQPTISHKLGEHLAVGGGPALVLGNAKLKKALPYNDGMHGDASVDLDGKGTSFGFNIGALLQKGKFSLGINYRSSAKVKINSGDATFNNVPASLIANNTFPTSTAFKTEITLPAVISAGAAFKMSEKVTFNLDLNFTQWSVYDSLNFEFPDYTALNTHSPRNYKDVFAARAGIQYTWNEKLNIRGGLAFDQSPVKDGYISPELPDGNKLVVSTGFTYQFKSKFALEGSLMFENIKERKESSNIEGNFNGTYKSIVYVIGLGVQYVF